MQKKPYKQPISILAIIHDEQQNILLLNRADVPEYWQSVTGSKEIGETIAQTAAREIFEETGIDTTKFTLHNWHKSHDYEIYAHWLHRYPPNTTHNTEHVFSLCIPQETMIRLQPAEHLAFVWLSKEEAAKKVFSPSNSEAILTLPQKGILHV